MSWKSGHSNAFQALVASDTDNWSGAAILERTCVILVILFSFDLVFLQHGRIISLSGFPLRKVIFILLIVVGTYYFVRHKVRPTMTWFGAIVLGVAVPLVWGGVGIVRGSRALNVFDDANGQIYFLLIIPLSIIFEVIRKKKLCNTLYIINTVNMFVFLISIISIFIFIFCALEFYVAANVERFLRVNDYGFLNIDVAGKPYRLFLKSFIFVSIFLCYNIYLFILKYDESRRIDKLNCAYSFVMLVTILISGTWSLWLATVLGIAFVLVFGLTERNRRFVGLLLMGYFVIGVIALLYIDPDHIRWAAIDPNIAGRGAQFWQLVDGMDFDWVLGKGYGSVVDEGSGAIGATRYSLELDLVNLFRKLGIVGSLIYLAGILMLTRAAFSLIRDGLGRDEVALLFITFIVVFTAGAFNPYATASLGIGAIVIGVVSVEHRLLAGRNGSEAVEDEK